jgi:hypothetical protein
MNLRLTKNRLKQIIKEELDSVMFEEYLEEDDGYFEEDINYLEEDDGEYGQGPELEENWGMDSWLKGTKVGPKAFAKQGRRNKRADRHIKSVFGDAGALAMGDDSSWQDKSGATHPEFRPAPPQMKPDWGRNSGGGTVTAGEYEAGKGVGGSGIPAGPYQDASPAGSGMDADQSMAGPAQLASIEPTGRYMGMSVRWLKRRGWKWNPKLGDFAKRTKTLRQHMARWGGRRKKWNKKPSGQVGGYRTSQD